MTRNLLVRSYSMAITNLFNLFERLSRIACDFVESAIIFFFYVISFSFCHTGKLRILHNNTNNLVFVI